MGGRAVRQVLRKWHMMFRKASRRVLIVFENSYLCNSHVSKFKKQAAASKNKSIAYDFIPVQEFRLEIGIRYHLCFFVVKNSSRVLIEEKFHMLNIFIKKPLDLSDFQLDMLEIPNFLVKRDKLSSILRNKSLREAEFILEEMVTNNRNKNHLNILEIKRCIRDNDRYKDCDVFYED